MNTHDTTDPSTLVPTGNTYDKYNTTNPIERRMMERFFTTLDRFIGTTRPERILEVGLGEGLVSERLRDRFPDARDRRGRPRRLGTRRPLAVARPERRVRRRRTVAVPRLVVRPRRRDRGVRALRRSGSSARRTRPRRHRRTHRVRASRADLAGRQHGARSLPRATSGTRRATSTTGAAGDSPASSPSAGT